MPQNMEKIDELRVRYDISLDCNRDILSLFSMTPYYWRTSVADAEKLTSITQLDTEIDFMISVYKVKKGGEPI